MPEIEQHQDLELAFGCSAPGQRKIEAALAADHVAVALLEGNHRPANACKNFPEADPFRVDAPPRCALVSPVERGAVGDSAGFAIKPREAPAFTAKPGDILVRIAPAGEFPIENSGQLGAIQHVIAGAEIVMTKHWLGRRWDMRLKPTDAPFEHRPWRRMTVEIGKKPSDLLRRPDLRIGRQEIKIRAWWTDRVDAGKLPGKPLGNCRERRLENGIAGDPMSRGDPIGPAHNKKRPTESGGIVARE